MHIFRDRYERKLPQFRPRNCVRNPEDYPEDEDLVKIIHERFLQ